MMREKTGKRFPLLNTRIASTDNRDKVLCELCSNTHSSSYVRYIDRKFTMFRNKITDIL